MPQEILFSALSIIDSRLQSRDNLRAPLKLGTRYHMHMLLNQHFIYSLVLLTVAATPICSFAQPDFTKPVYIYADNAAIDEDLGLSTYSGNVRVEQNNIELLADKITVNFSKDKAEHILATGNPVQYREYNANGVYLFGSGENMEYVAEKDTVVLSGNATIKKKNDELRGEHLIYSLRDNRLQASGKTDNRRVQTILQPSLELLKKSSKSNKN